MNQRPDYRRHRLIVAGIAALVIFAARDHDEPRIGTLAVTVGPDHLPHVSTELAPALAGAASVLTAATALIFDR
ncbi:hypothetical protein [Sphingomonas sp.]|uniref:hypothetical protein n=1 Tax=Sphingomonas sp. TaxID=28214 RepID=UPI0035C7D7BF